MKLIFIACIVASFALIGCAHVQAAPPTATQAATGTVTLTADVTDGNATHCGGYINGVRIPDVPLQSTAPKCKLVNPPNLNSGGNSWKACNSTPGNSSYTEGCNATVLNFSVAPSTTPLQPPTNLNYMQGV
jgi:hypothetical protein